MPVTDIREVESRAVFCLSRIHILSADDAKMSLSIDLWILILSLLILFPFTHYPRFQTSCLQESSSTTKRGIFRLAPIMPITLVLELISIWFMLMIAGLLPYPCQKDFDFDRRLSTWVEGREFIGQKISEAAWPPNREENETLTEYSGNSTKHALDFLCWN